MLELGRYMPLIKSTLVLTISGKEEGQFEFEFDVRRVTNAGSLHRCDFSSKLVNIMISMDTYQPHPPAKVGPVVHVTLFLVAGRPISLETMFER